MGIKTHGMSNLRTQKGHPLYGLWLRVRNRCNNPSNDKFKYYGGRGIKVCKRWNDFAMFVSDMGEKPPGYSIDRIANNKGYSPDNCRWADSKTQARNKRNNRVTICGETKSFIDWCEINGINWYSAHRRRSIGWCKQCACSIPIRGGTCIHK